MLTTLAVLFYVVTAALCVRAMPSVQRLGLRENTARAHRQIWIAAATVFAAVAISRQFGVEEYVRVWLRGGLRADGLYNERRDFQSLIASLLILAAAVGGLAAFSMMLRSRVLEKAGPSRVVAVAAIGCMAMVLLVLLRLVSLHMLDVLLFRGPRLNWFIDIGSTIVVGAAALRYGRMRHLAARR